jgi:ABC-2 type transport system ATP-binding protein
VTRQAAEPSETLRVRDLHRWFDKRGAPRFHAVRGIDLEACAGQVVGFLGPNGAGKTTTIRVCATLLTPSAGSVEVAGFDVRRQTKDVRRSVGLVLGGDRGFYPRASAAENLTYFADLAMVGRRTQRIRNIELLERVGLADRANDRVETFSRGMKQRLHIARALLADPPIVLLDEPTIGLDAAAALDLRALVTELAADGRTVLLTTHYMHEAEALSHVVNVIVGGRILVSGSVGDVARVAGAGDVTTVAVDILSDEALAAIRGIDGVIGVESAQLRGIATAEVAWRDGSCDPESLVKELSRWNPRILSTRAATLEEAYLALVSPRREQPVESALPGRTDGVS